MRRRSQVGKGREEGGCGACWDSGGGVNRPESRIGPMEATGLGAGVGPGGLEEWEVFSRNRFKTSVTLLVQDMGNTPTGWRKRTSVQDLESPTVFSPVYTVHQIEYGARALGCEAPPPARINRTHGTHRTDGQPPAGVAQPPSAARLHRPLGTRGSVLAWGAGSPCPD